MNVKLVFGLICLVSSIIGFIATLHLHVRARHIPFPGPDHVFLTKWVSRFYGGTAVLVVLCMMGPDSPLPRLGDYYRGFGFGTVVATWFLACSACYAVALARELHRRDKRERGRLVRPYFRHARVAPIAALLLLIALAAPGCAQDPVTQAYQTRQSYVLGLQTLDGLTVAQKISPAQAKEILALRPIADAAEKALDSQTPGTAAWNAALTAFQAAVKQLLTVQNTATTQPAKGS